MPPSGLSVLVASVARAVPPTKGLVYGSSNLLTVSRELNTRVVGDVPEDVNSDGVVDVLDLAIVASYFGQGVPI